MVFDNVKRQHYVWRKYLSAWTNNNSVEGSINCLFKSKNEIHPANLMNVAQERYFYRTEEPNQKEIILVKEFINKINNGYVKEQAIDLIDTVKSAFDIYKMLSSNIRCEEGEKYWDTLKKQIMEKLICESEDEGIKYLEKIRNGDISFYDEKEDIQNFNEYLSIQFMRTNWCKQRIRKIIEEIDADGINFENVYILLLMTMPSHIFVGITENKMKLILLQNETTKQFITADSPIINLKADPKSYEEPKKLEWYYPVSPTMAIILTGDINMKNKVITEEQDIQFYNDLMAEYAYNQIYSKSNIELNRYIK